MRKVLGIMLAVALAGCAAQRVETDAAVSSNARFGNAIVDQVVDAVVAGADVSKIEGVPPLDDITRKVLPELAGCQGLKLSESSESEVVVQFPCKPTVLEGGPSELVATVLAFEFSHGRLVKLNAFAIRRQVIQ